MKDGSRFAIIRLVSHDASYGGTSVLCIVRGCNEENSTGRIHLVDFGRSPRVDADVHVNRMQRP